MKRLLEIRRTYQCILIMSISLFSFLTVFTIPLLCQEYHLETQKIVEPISMYEKGCGVSPEKATVTLTIIGTGDCPTGGLLDIMLIIDRSTTMLQQSRIDSAKAAAKAFVDLMRDQDRVGLVSFAGDIQLNKELTNMDEAGKTAVKAAIDGIDAYGYTNIGDAIRTANKELMENGKSDRSWIEVLLSDGLPNRPLWSPDPVEYAVTAADTARRLDIPIYTIGLALQVQAGIELLQSIADTSGAKYYDSPTPNELRDIFLEIGGEVLCRAGTDITVTEVVRTIFTVEDAFTVTPASIDVDPIFGTTIVWYIDEILVDEEWIVSFDISSSEIGLSHPIDNTNASTVVYTRNGDQLETPFPQAYLTVNPCELPQLECYKIDVFGGEIGPTSGDTLQYNIMLTNNGPFPVTNAVFNDTPDSYTTLINGSVHTSQGTIVTGNTPGDQSVAIAIGTMSPGQEITILFRVFIDTILPQYITSISNQGFLSVSQVDPIPTDDPHTPEPNDPTTTSLTRPPSLEGTKRDFLVGDSNGDGLPGPGDTLRYIIEITNQGLGEALGVTFVDTLEPQVDLVAGSVVTSQGDILQGNSPFDTLVFIYIGTLPGGGSVTVDFLVTIGTLLSSGVTKISNQGMICYLDADCEPTDDPDTPPDDDPTVTESYRILFKRGNNFNAALASSYCPFYRVYNPPENSPALIQITTYTFDPAHDLYWCDPILGPLYPGSNLYITYTFRTGSPVDSIFIHIPAKGTKNIERHPIYRAIGSSVGLWEKQTLGEYDYYGYDWTVYDETQEDDGFWPVVSEIYLNEGGIPQLLPDTTYVILDTEDPIYHLTYSRFSDGLPLPTIPHPTLGLLPITTDQKVRIKTTVDQTVTVQGNGRLWSYMDIFVFAPGEKVDIDGVPAYADLLGEVSRWVNDPPYADTLDYNYVWNVREANGSCEGVATVRIKGRDTASNLVDIEDGEPNTGLHVLIDISAPTSPLASKIIINDKGSVFGQPGAVGTDWFSLGLTVNVYDEPSLVSPLASFQAAPDGSFNSTLPLAPAAGSLLYVTASDRAGHESDPTPIVVRLGTAALEALKTVSIVGNHEANPGDTLEYEITVINPGEVMLTNVVFTDVPGAFTYLVSGSVTASQGTIFSGNSMGDGYVGVNIGSLSGGHSVLVSFRAVIDPALPEEVHEVTNQGAVTCIEVPLILTDDPATPALWDPTVIPVFSALITVTFQITAGWNALSVPVIPEDPDMWHIFPGAREIWAYNGGYLAAGNVIPGQGYFVLYDFPTTVTVTGTPIELYTKNMSFGWNFIGAISQEVPVSSILNTNTGQPATENCLDPTAVYEYRNERYYFSTRLVPTKAYWAFAFSSCPIEVSTLSSGRSDIPEYSQTKQTLWAMPLTLTSGSASQTLEFGVSEMAGREYDPGYDRLIPPHLPIKTPIKAYFTSGQIRLPLSRDIQNPSNPEWTLHIESEDAITLKWNPSNLPADQSILLKMENGEHVDLQRQSTLNLIAGHHCLRIQLTTLLQAFTLYQNNPNPFNPITDIRYHIADQGSPVQTSLKIYNILGQEIRTLVDDTQNQGLYTVTWDGRDTAGHEVPSGIYFYRLQAGSFRETRQMMLLK